MSYTKGPWIATSTVIRPTEDSQIVADAGNREREEASKLRKISKEERMENSILIAAAPELLEACKEAINWLDFETRRYCKSETQSEVSNILARAIAKAGGKTI